MRAYCAVLAATFALAATSPSSSAQDPPPQMAEAMARAGAVNEHHTALAKLAGEWTLHVKMYMDPSAPPTEMNGTSSMRVVMDGRFVEGDIESEFMGQPFHGRWLIGYNNLTGQYESTWHDNMNTAIPFMTGSANATHDKFTFEGRYKDPMSGDWVETRSVMTFVSPTEIREVAYETRGGQEVRTMEIAYTKK